MTVPDATDALYIHPADTGGNSIVTKIFDGRCFLSWRRSIVVSLSVKNKLGFVDGSLPRTTYAADPVKLALWDRCDNLVISWLLNALDKKIAESVLFATTSSAIWSQLNSRFGRVSGAQKFSIQKDLSSLHQGTDDISTYFTKIKALWDEMDSLKTVAPCTCGNAGAILKEESEYRLYQFLMGLNDSYLVFRGNILLRSPIPDMDTVYSLLIQEEQQRENKSVPISLVDASSFQTNSVPAHSTNYKGKNPKMCSFCKKPGHLVETCYRVIGFPKDFKKSNGSSAHCATTPGASSSTEQSSALSPSELSQLRSLLQTVAPSSGLGACVAQTSNSW